MSWSCLVSDLCPAPAENQSQVPSPNPCPPLSAPSQSLSLALGQHWAALLGVRGNYYVPKFGCFFPFRRFPVGGYPLSTCCACLSRKNFPGSIRVIQNRKREMPLCRRLPRPWGLGAQGCPELVWTLTCEWVCIETAQRWTAWCLGCAGREGIVGMASTSTGLLVDAKFFTVPWGLR